jgi:LacI family transcriptional regulator
MVDKVTKMAGIWAVLRKSQPRVALLVETSQASGRDILRGIARYIREQGPWSIFHHEPRSLERSVPGWLKNWDGDGIIARIQNPAMAATLASIGIPTVDVLGRVKDANFPLVHVDDAAIGRLGAEHLHERGFRHFGFFGIQGENWSARRREAFTHRAADWQCRTAVLEVHRRMISSSSWEHFEDKLATWIANLSKPAGVMLASDQLGPYLLEACRRAAVHVPEEIGVVGVDNDELWCWISDPPLSSIQPNHVRVGYEAARLLYQLLDGQPLPRQPLLVPPSNIVTRLSTNILAVADPFVVAAVRFIQEHACEGINVADVVEHVAVCRSILQRHFQSSLKRTIHDEIIRVRLERAKELLGETDLPLQQVAKEAGFRHQEYMGAVFKARLGLTPSRFRRAAKDAAV